MHIEEKGGLYQFCRIYFHEEYFNLDEVTKAAVKLAFSKTRMTILLDQELEQENEKEK